MKEIPIQGSGGYYALVDDEDYPLLSRFTWNYSDGYACTHMGSGTAGMHQLVCPCGPGCEPHHKNDRRLDNRKENLEPVTRARNILLAQPDHRNKTGYKGVAYEARTSKYVFQARLPGGSRTTQRFNTAHEAAVARAKYHNLPIPEEVLGV